MTELCQYNCSSHLLTYVTLCLLSFGVGVWIGTEDKCSRENSLLDATYAYKEENSTVVPIPDDSIYPFSSHQCAFNSGHVYSQLTQLHERSMDLQNRKRTGEANRARTATINRKAGQALSAEHAFRRCMQGMMPELLDRWDRDKEQHLLTYRGWSDEKKTSIGDITLSELMETAESLE